MYKLIAIDLDGTLLNAYGEVSEENKRELNRAKEKGIEIVLASGRTRKSVESFALEIGADNYLISGNGSIIYDIKNEKIIYNRFMEREKILEIIKICEENNIYYNIYTEEAVITKALKYNTLFYHQENKNKSENKKTKINIIKNIYKYIEDRKEEDYSKITICDESQLAFIDIIKKIKTIKGVSVLETSQMTKKIIKKGTENIPLEYFYTEITNENVNKWTAIEYLINLLKIKKEEVIAIGDNMNDKEMLEHAKIGVATGNSKPFIKNIADLVVSDNDSNGVADAISKMII